MQESLLYTTITYRRTMSGGIRLRGLHNVIQVDASRRCNIVDLLVIRLIYIRSMSNTVMCVVSSRYFMFLAAEQKCLQRRKFYPATKTNLKINLGAVQIAHLSNRSRSNIVARAI